jgi:lipid-A-disaccharide synthase
MKYFLFAGETSGDLHGSHLMQALQVNDKSLSLCGVGGPLMRQEGLECFIEMEQFQVMGLTDVLRSLPRLLKLFYQTRDLILNLNPDCVILIDYPAFNLRLAASLRKKGFKGKLVQYICPSVWAHGKKRVDILAANYDLLLTVYPFEEAYFSHTALKVEYIGNPLGETIRKHTYQPDWEMILGLPTGKKLIALFPGSRLGEIHNHIPLQLQTAALLKEQDSELCFALSCAQDSLHQDLCHLVQKGPLRLEEDLYIIPSSYRYDLMKTCHFALAKSGTVTLELAYHAVPTVVHYELSILNYLFAKYILRLNLPHYCIVNILGNRTIFPEIMGRKISPHDLKKNLESFLYNSNQREQIRKECQELTHQLGEQSTHQCAARAIRDIMP